MGKEALQGNATEGWGQGALVAQLLNVVYLRLPYPQACRT